MAKQSTIFYFRASLLVALLFVPLSVFLSSCLSLSLWPPQRTKHHSHIVWTKPAFNYYCTYVRAPKIAQPVAARGTLLQRTSFRPSCETAPTHCRPGPPPPPPSHSVSSHATRWLHSHSRLGGRQTVPRSSSMRTTEACHDNRKKLNSGDHTNRRRTRRSPAKKHAETRAPRAVLWILFACLSFSGCWRQKFFSFAERLQLKTGVAAAAAAGGRRDHPPAKPDPKSCGPNPPPSQNNNKTLTYVPCSRANTHQDYGKSL